MISRNASSGSGADHDVPLSPSRYAQSLRRLPASRKNRTESVLSSLQIMGSVVPKASFRSYRVHTRYPLQIVGGGLSKSINLSRSPHSDPQNPRPLRHRHSRRTCGSLGPRLPQHRVLAHQQSLPHPVPRVVADRQVTPPGVNPRPTLQGFQPHVFISPSRGFRIGRPRLRD